MVALVSAPVLAGDPNALTEAENEAGFELPFNGKDFNGWKQNGNWVARDGAMFRGEKGGGISYSVKPIPDDFDMPTTLSCYVSAKPTLRLVGPISLYRITKTRSGNVASSFARLAKMTNSTALW